MNALVITSTVATADIRVGLCANNFTVDVCVCILCIIMLLDNIFHLDVYYVSMLVQRIEPQGIGALQISLIIIIEK